jgi:hypothetical protein
MIEFLWGLAQNEVEVKVILILGFSVVGGRTEEIDAIVKGLPADKAPSSDGFNDMFNKKCWHIINHSFYELISQFYNGPVNLQSINSSFITLVPKVQSPSMVNDYKTISLLGGPIKLITKLLANRI